MLIRTPQDWELPESAATPESLYHLSKRRDFLKALGVGGAALAAREVLAATAYGASEKWRASATADPVAFRDAAAALLLIDGCPHWVWLNSTVVELL